MPPGKTVNLKKCLFLWQPISTVHSFFTSFLVPTSELSDLDVPIPWSRRVRVSNIER